MSATQTLAVEKILIRHNFTEAEATEILDYVENQKGDFATKQDIHDLKRDITWLKWIIGLGFGGLLTIMLYLHNDTKQKIKELKIEIDRRFTEQKQDIKSINEKLDRLLSREKR